MNLADDFQTTHDATSCSRTPVGSARTRSLNRIAEVQKQQGVSPRSIVRRTGLSMDQVRRQSAPDADLKLSELLVWQRALEVPLADLMVDADAPLSSPVLDRARMLRAMKTVRAMKDANDDPTIGRFILMLENQMLEIMPELQDVAAWHSVGQRRTHDEVGRVAERQVPDSFVRDGMH